VSFRHCEFSDCGSYGVMADSSSVMIRNSVFQNVKGRGISLTRGGAAEITNTVARACSTSGIAATELTSPRIVNCVLTDNGYHGLHLVNNSNAVVLNSIIWANHRMGVRAEQTSQPVLEYNLVGANGEQDLYPSSLGCDNCLFVDPQFVGGNDVHLSGGSPCINAGHPDPQYYDTNGSRNDMGAYGGPAGGSVGASTYPSNRLVVQR
jgi:parallel beta-helix repeat protein